MLSKESVKKRIETGISFTEFSYQLLQGYDFQILMEDFGVSLQMGSTDQWGNITSGTEFIRRNTGKKAYALTSPLLVKADGNKFGKSTEGNIWLDPDLTSPYQFYQFWINGDDRDIDKFIRIFSLKSVSELKSWLADETDPRILKRELAKELTVRIHGEEEYESVLKVSELLFNPRINQDFVRGLSEKELQRIAAEIPTFQIDRSIIDTGGILDVAVGPDRVFSSNGEGRRAIQGNAVSINKLKINDFEHKICSDDLLYGKYILLENGKKNKFIAQINPTK